MRRCSRIIVRILEQRGELVCRGDDRLTGSIVDVELERLRIREIMRERGDVFRSGAEELVDRLAGVADDPGRIARPAQRAKQARRRPRHVLEFVDDHPWKTCGVRCTNAGVLFENANGKRNQIGKVYLTVPTKAGLISAEQRGELSRFRVRVVERIRPDEALLAEIDVLHHASRGLERRAQVDQAIARHAAEERVDQLHFAFFVEELELLVDPE